MYGVYRYTHMVRIRFCTHLRQSTYTGLNDALFSNTYCSTPLPECHHQIARVLNSEFTKLLTPCSSPDWPPAPWVLQGRSGDNEVRLAHPPEEDEGQVQALQDRVSAPCRPGSRLGQPHAHRQVGGRAQKHARGFTDQTESEWGF